MRTASFIPRYLLPWLVPLWLLYAAASWLWPPTFWMDVRSVHVSNGNAGEPLLMVFDRDIKRDFNGRWTAQARSLVGGRSSVICSASSSHYYRTSDVLPTTITLGWWTNGICESLPPGVYVLDTTWRIESEWLLRDKFIHVASNVFEVK